MIKWGSRNDILERLESGNIALFVVAAVLFVLVFASINEQVIVHGIDIAFRK
jgi:hypothetical protein